MPHAEKTNCKPDIECLGGHAFLLMACGLFCLIPGSILMAIYGDVPGFSALRLGTYILFIVGASFLIIGVLLTIYWCQVTGYKSLQETSSDAESGKDRAGSRKVNEEAGDGKQKDKHKPSGSGAVEAARSEPPVPDSEESVARMQSKYADYSAPSPITSSSTTTYSSENGYQYDNPVLRQELYGDEDDGY